MACNRTDCLLLARAPGSDPASAADSISPQPRLTAKQKGKGRASGLDLNLDAGLHAIAGKFGNPSVRQPPNDKPFKQPSANALGKAAALEESILVGLYTQCTETSQKIWKSEKELLMLAEPWMTVQTKILAPRLTALTARKHLEVHVRGTDLPVYSFTWEGYKIAETAASGKGLQPVAIVQNDLILPERPVVQQSMTSVNGRSPTSTIRDALESGLSNNAASECGVTAARPKSIVSVPRNAPIAGQFATVIPRKRAAEETYQGLSQYTRAAADESADATASVHTAHRPINKRFAAPSIASVFQDKPTAAPAAHSNGET